MTHFARTSSQLAAIYIECGNIAAAMHYLRLALRETSNRRSWSKLMLALRELSKVGRQP